MAKTIEEMQAEILALQTELDKVQTHQALVNMGDVQAIATELHSRFCRHDHTEGCGWYYESRDGVEDWNGSTHIDWVKRAKAVIDRCGSENLLAQMDLAAFIVYGK